MAVIWGDFESVVLHYLKVLGWARQERVMVFRKGEGQVYGVGTYADYKRWCDEGGEAMYRPVMAMTADEFIGLMLVRVSDIVEEATSAHVKESVQAGDESSGESASVDAGADRQRKGYDACCGSDAAETHKADA